MRNKLSVTPPLGVVIDHPYGAAKHAVLQRVRNALAACIDWLRAGYPDEAPRTGHSPLLALYGPLALTPDQKNRVSKDLAAQSSTAAIDIDVAITKVTNRLPTPTQTRSISRTLHHRDSHQ